MRRVSAAKAKPGMVLRGPVFDVRGERVLDEGKRLTDDDLPRLLETGVAEILIDDRRLDDVPVGFLFPPHLEARAVRALHLLPPDAATDGLQPGDVRELQATAEELVDCLFPAFIADPDVVACTATSGYDRLHAVKTATLALVVGRLLDMDERALRELALGAMLQNVGYLAMPPGILDSPVAPLTPQQRAEILRHPEAGRRMLLTAGVDDIVLEMVLQHHERWDGSGYPGGLQGDQIVLPARIIAVADVFFSLVSHRAHRPPVPHQEALEFIRAHGNDLFDARIVETFVRRVPVYPAGLGVRLNTGEVGIVADPNAGQMARPVVRVCLQDGRPVEKPFDLDLSSADNLEKRVTAVLL